MATEFDLRQTGKNLWKTILDQSLAMTTGRTAPWELPQFKQMMPFLTSQWDKSNKELYQTAFNKGIYGGSLGGIMEQGEENKKKAILQLIVQMYNQGMDQGTGAWQNFLNLRGQNIGAMNKPEKPGFNWMSLIPLVGNTLTALTAKTDTKPTGPSSWLSNEPRIAPMQ